MPLPSLGPTMCRPRRLPPNTEAPTRLRRALTTAWRWDAGIAMHAAGERSPTPKDQPLQAATWDACGRLRTRRRAHRSQHLVCKLQLAIGCMSDHLSRCLPASLLACLPARLQICPPARMPARPPARLHACLPQSLPLSLTHILTHSLPLSSLPPSLPDYYRSLCLDLCLDFVRSPVRSLNFDVCSCVSLVVSAFTFPSLSLPLCSLVSLPPLFPVLEKAAKTTRRAPRIRRNAGTERHTTHDEHHQRRLRDPLPGARRDGGEGR